MAKMTKAQARRRLREAQEKFLKVYMSKSADIGMVAVTTSDMMAIEKIVKKCLNRLK